MNDIPQTPEPLLNIVREMMAAVPYCFFMTQNGNGRINARLMQPFPPEEDLTLYFGTSPNSRKAADIRANQRVSVAFQSNQENAYVTLNGSARLIDNLADRQRYWLAEWQPFFPYGPDGDDYVLIRFAPDRIETLNFARGITPEPFGLHCATLLLTKGGWVFA
jgi:general stress protein 26